MIRPEKYMLILAIFALSACGGVAGLVSVSPPVAFKASDVVTEKAYLQTKDTNGVVLLDVNWGRQWNCGRFQNAQLVSLAFDKLPVADASNEAQPSLALQSSSRLMVDPVFRNYAYSLEPGEYAISAVSIKVAASISKVGYFNAERDRLYDKGRPLGGTFTVKPKEAVFIGNFFLDCAYGPTLWRYYSDGRAGFASQVKEYRKSFPFLDLDNVAFRLFKTDAFGEDYVLE